MRLAVWSGPRNLSTAMMYAFANRGDMHPVDEPFYAAYLSLTGRSHPMGAEILASQPRDPARVVDTLLAPIPDGKPHAYHKHMAQHLVSGVPRNWITEVTNVLLIRDPARVVASFTAKYESPTLDEIGVVQQAELLNILTAAGRPPIVVDSAAIRSDPATTLGRLCEAVGLDYSDKMLSWSAGGHPADGVWAPVWYGAVHRSTGFAGPEGPLPALDGEARRLAEAARPHYDRLLEVAI